MEANITTTAIEVVAGVVEVGLVGLLALLFAWIKKNTKSDTVKSAIDLLEQAAKDTVGELQQTLVEGWKRALYPSSASGGARGALAISSATLPTPAICCCSRAISKTISARRRWLISESCACTTLKTATRP